MPIYNSFHRRTTSGQQNVFPAGLQIQGAYLPVQVEVPPALASQLQQSGQVVPNPVAGFALIDTGASLSAVDATVMQQLGVQPVGVANVGTAGGVQQQPLFPARFTFPGANIPDIDFNRLFGCNLGNQQIAGRAIVALLGRDLLSQFVFIYNGPGGMFSIAF